MDIYIFLEQNNQFEFNRNYCNSETDKSKL